MNDLSALDSATLVANCRAGDAASWRALVQRYERLVYAIVRRAGLDEHTAADVFQVVFARLLEHLPGLKQPDRLQAWIVTTAKREALRERQRSSRTVSLTRPADADGDAPEDSIADESPLAEQALDDLQQLDRVRRGLDRLDARCRELLLMIFSDEDERLPYEEVSRRLSMPVGSIGPTRARCLQKLRGTMEA
jgi:RNA polymerase sigma factor (sigma-70 family)